MKFNVNDSVRVRLTDRGRAILAAKPYPIVEKEGADGWTTYQLWVLMQEFGEHVGNGIPPPFETTIEIVGE